MAKKMGNNYRLWVNTTATQALVKGQQSLSQSGSSATIDTSDKDNSPYGTVAPGNFDMTISFELFPDLPDTTGYTRMETLFLTQAAEEFQIRKGGASGADPADVVFEASCYVLSFAKSYGKNDVVKVTGTLGLATAPTVNLLA